MTEQKKLNPSPSSIPMNDPRYPIWGRQYKCKAPRIAHYNTEWLETRGLPTSGNQAVDIALMRQMQMCYLTINEMLTYYHDFTTVCLVRQEDTKHVYEACQDYTFNAAEQIRNNVFNHNVPFADLIAIDEFAEAVYQHAGHLYGTEFARTFVAEDVMKNVLDMNAMFAAIDKRVADRGKAKEDPYTVYTQYSPQGAKEAAREEFRKNNQEDEKKLPPRPTMRDIFESYMSNQRLT